MNQRWRENPFFVLGLSPSASAQDVERAGQRLLGLLEIGAASARHYATPEGDEERTPELVRSALAELRDENKRQVHELWARMPARPSAAAPSEAPTRAAIMRSFGWPSA